jgi:anaerobic ribonucleoside-triphosphate reductase
MEKLQINISKNTQIVKEKKLVIPCEVYSRVVGYYRPVQHWNIGKKQEFKERKTYDRTLFGSLTKIN